MPTLAKYEELLLEVQPRPIRTKADYRRVLKQLDDLMVPHPPREQAMMIDLLAVLVEQYEASHFPIPRKLTPSEYVAELMEAPTATTYSRLRLSREKLSAAITEGGAA